MEATVAFLFGVWLGGALFMACIELGARATGVYNGREHLPGCTERTIWMIITWPAFLWRSAKRWGRGDG